MAEAKVSKAKLKQLESDNRHAFMGRVFDIVAGAIPSASEYARRLDVRITGKGYARYIRFSDYGMGCKFQIFPDGNIGLELKEMCQPDYNAQLFAFTEDEEAQHAFEERLKGIVDWLLWLLSEKYVHEFMDYLTGADGDFDRAHALMAEQWKRVCPDISF